MSSPSLTGISPEQFTAMSDFLTQIATQIPRTVTIEASA